METATMTTEIETAEQVEARLQAHVMAICTKLARELTIQGGGQWIVKPKDIGEHRYEAHVVHAETGDYLTAVGAFSRGFDGVLKTSWPKAWSFHPNGRMAGEKREIRYPVNEAGDPNWTKIVKRVQERIEATKRSNEYRAAQRQAAALATDKLAANDDIARKALDQLMADGAITMSESSGYTTIQLRGTDATGPIGVSPTVAGVTINLTVPADRVAAILLAIRAAS